MPPYIVNDHREVKSDLSPLHKMEEERGRTRTITAPSTPAGLSSDSTLEFKQPGSERRPSLLESRGLSPPPVVLEESNFDRILEEKSSLDGKVDQPLDMSIASEEALSHSDSEGKCCEHRDDKEKDEEEQTSRCLGSKASFALSREDSFSAVGEMSPVYSPPNSRMRGIKRRVTFAEEPIVIGTADADYDRRSIRVDLGKTPFALFHKDAYFMKHPEEYTASPRSPNRRDSRSFSGEDMEGAENENSDEESRPRPNFSGVWKRYDVEGFEELLIFSGIPPRAAKAASSRSPIHIIDHDDVYCRIIVKNGLVKADNHYIVGDEPRTEQTGGNTFDVSLEWADGSGDGSPDSLVLASINQDDGTEMIAIRTLEEKGEVIILQQIVRKPATGGEARARHVFRKITNRKDLNVRRSSTTAPSVVVRRSSL